MAFFDDLGKLISEKGHHVVNKTKELTEITKLSARISDLQRKNDNIYRIIGKMYVDNFGSNPEHMFKDAIHSIMENQKKIVTCREEIKILKGIRKCPSCGADVHAGSQFCSKCGARVEDDDVVADAEAEIVNDETETTFDEVSEETVEEMKEKGEEKKSEGDENAKEGEEAQAEESAEEADGKTEA